MRYTCTWGRAAWACAWLLAAAAPAFPQPKESFPPAKDSPAAEKPANLVIRLPAAARLVVDGKETKQTGPVRTFFSPPLPIGQVFRYELEATWTGPDGKTVRVPKVVRVRAGETTAVDLRTPEKAPGDNPPVDRPPVDKPPVDKPPVDKTPVDKTPVDKTLDRDPDVIYVPTPMEVVDKMLEMAAVKKGDVVYDLGCGDGRIVVEAAKKYGCKAVGIDIDPKFDLEPASVVTLYLLPGLNLKLVPKLNKMKPGSRVVSHNYDIEGYKPKKVEQVMVKMLKDGKEQLVPHSVYLWEVPLEKE